MAGYTKAESGKLNDAKRVQRVQRREWDGQSELGEGLAKSVSMCVQALVLRFSHMQRQ